MGNSSRGPKREEGRYLLPDERQVVREFLESGQLKSMRESGSEEDQRKFERLDNFSWFSSSPLALSFNSLLNSASRSQLSTAGILIRGSVHEKTSLISDWFTFFSQNPGEQSISTFIVYFLQTLFTWSKTSDLLVHVISPLQETADSHPLHSVWKYSQEDGRAASEYFIETAEITIDSTQSRDVNEKCVRSLLESNPVLETAFSVFGILFFLSSLPPPDLLQLLGQTQDTSHPTYDATPSLLPPIVPKHQVFQSMLGPACMSVLSGHIPPALKGPARQLFCSWRDGESFAKLTECILNKGPTLIVVRDTEGHVFGGFASHSWELNPSFRGDGDCFLFTVVPHLEIFNKPTFYNKHFMYYQMNAETLPNGLGMGGQLEYFGLWLSADFGKGHSKAKPRCTTYASKQLSREEEFSIHSLEVWGLGQGVGVKSPHMKSALDQDPEAQAILEMAGKTLHSQGLREPESSDEDK